jgi:hypothetical protein
MVTEMSIPFVLAGAESLRLPSIAGTRGQLLAATIKLVIPSEIGLLPLDDYAEIRMRYAKVRSDIQAVMAEIQNIERFDEFEDTSIVARRINERVKQLRADADAAYLQSQRYGVTKRVTYYLSGMLSCLAALLPGAQALAAVGGNVLVTIIGSELQEARRPRDARLALLGQLRKDLLDAARARTITSPWTAR